LKVRSSITSDTVSKTLIVEAQIETSGRNDS